jgi:hypothetical protein
VGQVQDTVKLFKTQFSEAVFVGYHFAQRLGTQTHSQTPTPVRYALIAWHSPSVSRVEPIIWHSPPLRHSLAIIPAAPLQSKSHIHFLCFMHPKLHFRMVAVMLA